MMKNKNKKTKYFWAALVMAAYPIGIHAEEVTPETIKASYIIKLCPFITVGNPPHKIQKICYFEKPDVEPLESVGQILQNYLKNHAGENGIPLSVTWFQAIRGFPNCDLLYIPESEGVNIDNIVTSLGSESTVTLSAAKNFIYRGGMIGFLLDAENRVKLEANLKNLKANGVNVDAQLLEVMQRIERQ